MWKRRDTGWRTEAREQEYWLSYSDLMAGLLMMFALLLFAALHHYGGVINEARAAVGTRTDIIVRLDSIMRVDSTGVTVDPVTGAVKFPDGVLFDEGQARIRPEGGVQLDRFAEKYFSVLLGDSVVRRHLDKIIIEGHTNDNSSYEYNLDLSQQRAYAVMMHLLEAAPDYTKILQEYVTANGRSFSDAIRCEPGRVYDYPCPPGTVDKVRSRRIEILFRLKYDEQLRKIEELLGVSN